MARSTLTGSRIRERRIVSGIRQAELAKQAGISASYLNLIEHNRRRIGGALLVKLAEILGVEPSLLSEGAQATLVAALQQAANAPEGRVAELDRAEEFAGRFPGWAEVVAQGRQKIETLLQTVDILTDRLGHDPQLAASLHEVLSTVTSIRSTASILANTKQIEPEWRDRFHRNINEDANRLAQSSQALVAYLDGASDAATEVTSPQEEVELLLEAHGHHFPELEHADGDVQPLLEQLQSETARFMMTEILRRYQQAAMVAPLTQVADWVAAHGTDPFAMAADMGIAPDLAMRRLASLPDRLLPTALGYVECDASGTFLYRRPTEGFPMPRFGGACALWPVFAAANQPMVPQQQLVHQAGGDGQVFDTVALASPIAAPRLHQQVIYRSAMLITPAVSPDERAKDAVQELGVSCRICPKQTCTARREPAIAA